MGMVVTERSYIVLRPDDPKRARFTTDPLEASVESQLGSVVWPASPREAELVIGGMHPAITPRVWSAARRHIQGAA